MSQTEKCSNVTELGRQSSSVTFEPFGEQNNTMIYPFYLHNSKTYGITSRYLVIIVSSWKRCMFSAM